MKTNHYLLILLAVFFSACKVAEKEKAIVPPLFEVGGTPVSSDDFIYVYEKNNYNNKDISSREEIKDYLELYINFKLKIKEAEELGLNKSEAFNQELDGYKKQLARPYLTESQVTDSLVEEAYKRMKEEIKAAHILVSLNADSSPEDTLKAYKKIDNIRKQALKGGDFKALAREFSDDPYAENNSGDLGYFTALQMVYPFEDAAYKTPVGEISAPVRTRYGYHIIKVNDRRPSRGKIQVSHIMIRATEGMPTEDSLVARNKIFEIHQQLKSGGNWTDLAKQFSDDINTRNQGGQLPWFGTGNMIPEFEEAAYGLEGVGDISEPVKTAYGWHILKLDDKKELEPFEELSASIKSKVAKDSRSEMNKVALMKRLRKENNVVEYPEAINAALSKVDSTVFSNSKPLQENDKNLKAKLFSVQDSAYTTQQFYSYLKLNHRPENPTAPITANVLKQSYDKFFEEALLQYEESNLEEKYNDYRIIVNEYREGI
nr:peptidylprolyl isomerase [Bacteroidota bacterium]